METVLIDPERNSRLLELARSDRTLSVFFSASSQDALPDGLKRLLDESGTLDAIRLHIAPTYRERFRVRESKLVLRFRVNLQREH